PPSAAAARRGRPTAGSRVKFSYWANIRIGWFWRLVDGCAYILIDGSHRDSLLNIQAVYDVYGGVQNMLGAWPQLSIDLDALWPGLRVRTELVEDHAV
ncbi:MAG: hypothetical protein M3003_01750, partial [Candidatus Dormibacteraeota bacterium]|nr:hypothetical protein [Candidatus Dormibacteraeota bacterium]